MIPDSLMAFIHRYWKNEAEAIRVIDGGASNSLWVAEIKSEKIAIKRRDHPALDESADLQSEFILQRWLYHHQAPVPEPIACDGTYLAMRWIDGIVDPAELHLALTVEQGEKTVFNIGKALARLHQMGIENLDLRSFSLEEQWKAIRLALDKLPGTYPVLEWALKKLSSQAPTAVMPILTHRDFRLGNIIIEQSSHDVTAILDWEFAGLGDPYEDLGWFCARCWRFGNPTEAAGGLGPREAFYAGYEAGGGEKLDKTRLVFWERLAALRWAIIALHQGERYRVGRNPKLDLALTPLRALEAAYDLVMDLSDD